MPKQDKQHLSLLPMYTREIYLAIEAYADNRSNRSRYDAIIEQFVKQANEELEKDRSELSRGFADSIEARSKGL